MCTCLNQLYIIRSTNYQSLNFGNWWWTEKSRSSPEFWYFFSSPLQRIQKAQHITDLVVVAVLTSRGCTPALLLSIILNCPMLRLWLLAQVLVPWKIKVTLEALSCHYQQLPVRVFKPKGAQWLSVLFNWVVFPT